MKRLILVLVLSTAVIGVRAHNNDSLLVVFWNLENFFDWTDQGQGKSDKEFSSMGERRWTKSRFYKKCDDIAKSLMWIGDKYGRLPDVAGVCEVENKGVLRKLLSSTLLRKYDYDIVHFDSNDSRGIDVALLYRTSKMTPVSVSLKTVDSLSTRDILHVEMKVSDSVTVDFIVNHHPSKYGGEKVSEPKRIAVMHALKSVCDSLILCGRNKIVAMGDFNDTPDGNQFDIISEILNNKGLELHNAGEGTIRYKGKWDFIDNFLIGYGLKSADMEIVRIPFLMTYEKKYPGEKPLRTYVGPRYVGGVSDHCPITLWIYPFYD